MSLQNFPDGPATEESPRLRDRGTGSHQTPLSSSSEGSEGPRERVSAAVTALALRTSQLSTANKRKLIAECRRLGLPGNMNIARRTLQRRILAHLNDLRRAVDDADDASMMGRLDALLAATSGDLHAEDHGRPSSSGVGGARPDRTISADDAAAITPMDLEARPEREKRPGQPLPLPRDETDEPAARRQRRTGFFTAQIEARRRSNAHASIRPARLDELLATHAEMRRLNVCLRGLPESLRGTEEELRATVERVLRTLVGADVSFRECYSVGRVSTSRPRPVIICFSKLSDKIRVLRAKGALYDAENCPGGPTFRSLRIYHDLSPLQLDWKLRLKNTFDDFRTRGARVIWRNGYRLMVFTDGVWNEYVPESVLAR